MALGYLHSNNGTAGDMELKEREYFQILAMHSLFQEFRKDDLDGHIKLCKMHDIVHDFAKFVRKDRSNGSVGATMKKTTCQSYSPLLVSHVKEYRSLFLDHEPPNLSDCLTSLRVLEIRFVFQNIPPQRMANLIHLRWLDLTGNAWSMEDLKTIFQLYNLQTLILVNCQLQEIPREIGNLIHLRNLDLTYNQSLHELPESICGLHELRTLKIDSCKYLRGLPQGIHRLINLKHLHNKDTSYVKQFPHGVSQLTGLRTLTEFRGGSGWSKLGLLKNLNHLAGSLDLYIKLADDDLEDVVEDAREAELRKKIHIQTLDIYFHDMDEKEGSSERIMDVIDALEPHPNLQNLKIWHYIGSKLPDWIASPLNQLRDIMLCEFNHLSLLPPLGKLQCLEGIDIYGMHELEFVGREFLGIATTRIGTGDLDIQSSSSSVPAAINSSIGFPKLKKLTFRHCPKWKEWEDITAEEEEESAAVSLMSCLTKLYINDCKGLTALPHRLLRKASSLEMLHISGSTQLQQRYGDKDGSAWKSISQNNPRLQLKLTF